MKRILSILVLASILLCSFAACEGESSDSDYSANTKPETVDSEQEAVIEAKSYFNDYRIAERLGFTRYGKAGYFYQDVDVDYLVEGDYNYEHGEIEYTVCMSGDMAGQDAYGEYSIKKFEYVVCVYPDGHVESIRFKKID